MPAGSRGGLRSGQQRLPPLRRVVAANVVRLVVAASSRRHGAFWISIWARFCTSNDFSTRQRPLALKVAAG